MNCYIDSWMKGRTLHVETNGVYTDSKLRIYEEGNSYRVEILQKK